MDLAGGREAIWRAACGGGCGHEIRTGFGAFSTQLCGFLGKSSERVCYAAVQIQQAVTSSGTEEPSGTIAWQKPGQTA